MSRNKFYRLIVMLCLCSIFLGDRFGQYAQAKSSDFVIVKGVLTQYKGKSKKVTIPKSVKSIGDRAFYNCEYITSVVIPKTVKSVGDGAFSGCKNLAKISIPKTLKSFGAHPFFDTKWSNNRMENDMFLIVNGVLLGADSKKQTEELIIPKGVKIVNQASFNYWTGIESVTIPEGVEKIGNIAFMMCENLRSVSISNTVTSIEDGAFSDCYNLKSITLTKDTTFIGEGAFRACTSLTIYCPKNSYAQKYAKTNDIPYEIIK